MARALQFRTGQARLGEVAILGDEPGLRGERHEPRLELAKMASAAAREIC